MIKPTLKQRFLLSLGISLLPVIFFNVYHNFIAETPCPTDVSPWTKAGFDMLFSFAVTFSVINGCVQVMCWMDRRFPWTDSRQAKKRLVLETVSVSIWAAVAMTIMVLAFSKIAPWMLEQGTTLKEALWTNIVTAVIITIVSTAVWESIHFFRAWQTLVLKAEQLEKEKMRSQFETLRSQVNPHFLFNSLNTLSSLIHDNPDQAVNFTDQFATVYRYVLDTKDQHLVPLNEECEFVESYLFLQKIRFQQGLDVKITIEDAENYWVPPLSLQELVSNAIKHNVVSAARPLHIELFRQGKLLIVRNNLQLRADSLPSTQTGQDNLRKRYALFVEVEPYFEVTEEHYVSALPLITELQEAPLA